MRRLQGFGLSNSLLGEVEGQMSVVGQRAQLGTERAKGAADSASECSVNHAHRVGEQFLPRNSTRALTHEGGMRSQLKLP